MIMESRNASFFEHVFPCNSKGDQPSSLKRTFKTIEDNSQTHEENEIVEEELRRSKIAKAKKSFEPAF